MKRKKYLDDIDLNLSDDDPDIDVEGADGPIVKPVGGFKASLWCGLHFV